MISSPWNCTAFPHSFCVYLELISILVLCQCNDKFREPSVSLFSDYKIMGFYQRKIGRLAWHVRITALSGQFIWKKKQTMVKGHEKKHPLSVRYIKVEKNKIKQCYTHSHKQFYLEIRKVQHYLLNLSPS